MVLPQPLPNLDEVGHEVPAGGTKLRPQGQVKRQPFGQSVALWGQGWEEAEAEREAAGSGVGWPSSRVKGRMSPCQLRKVHSVRAETLLRTTARDTASQ